MDDESLKQRFEEVEKTISATEKRVDEAKLYAGGIAGLFTVWFAVLTLVLSWNYNSDKAALRDFQKDLREDLGRSVVAPELELIGLNDKPLDAQTIDATFEQKESTENGQTESYSRICLHFAIKNSGNETTGPLTVMVYTSDPIKLSDRCIDERDFQSVCLIEPKYNEPSELPGKLTTEWNTCCRLYSGALPAAGAYPALIKFFYGKGKMKAARISVRVPEHR